MFQDLDGEGSSTECRMHLTLLEYFPLGVETFPLQRNNCSRDYSSKASYQKNPLLSRGALAVLWENLHTSSPVYDCSRKEAWFSLNHSSWVSATDHVCRRTSRSLMTQAHPFSCHYCISCLSQQSSTSVCLSGFPQTSCDISLTNITLAWILPSFPQLQCKIYVKFRGIHQIYIFSHIKPKCVNFLV